MGFCSWALLLRAVWLIPLVRVRVRTLMNTFMIVTMIIFRSAPNMYKAPLR